MQQAVSESSPLFSHVRAIIFDVDNTLYRQTPEVLDDARTAWCAAVRAEVGHDHIPDFVDDIFLINRYGAPSMVKTGDASTILGGTPCTSHRKLHQAFHERWSTQHIKPYTALQEQLSDLQKSDVRLYLYSDAHQHWTHRVIEKLKLRDVFPAEHSELAVRIELFDDEIESLQLFDPLTGRIRQKIPRFTIYPSSHYVTPRDKVLAAVETIKLELDQRLKELVGMGKLVEAQRLEQRTRFDLEMLSEVGHCKGIENYTRHLSGAAPGEPPSTLTDYLPRDAIMFLDESHQMIGQLGGMYNGDRARKTTLVEYGFRLPSALDNRPLKFEEFERKMRQAIFVSATPAAYEQQHADQADDHPAEGRPREGAGETQEVDGHDGERVREEGRRDDALGAGLELEAGGRRGRAADRQLAERPADGAGRYVQPEGHPERRCPARARAAPAPEGTGAEPDARPVCGRPAQDRARDGEGRRRLPALRPVCRALPHRRLGHAEIPAEHHPGGPRLPRQACTGTPTGSGRMKRIEAINDFVIKFANVNGSGSASANELFAKAILRMGVPVSPRNIFPSNIQGLPTWYEVRVTEQGWLGRRGGIDMMVAMNPQTWDADVAELEPGGYLFYDSTRPLPPAKFRDDIHVIGMPLTEICNAVYSDPRQRQLFKNIVYVGALSVLLEIEPEVIEKLFGEQYKGKEKLLASNVQALHLGRDFAREHLSAPLGIRVRRADKVGERIFVDGNSAAALGCVYGGATVAAWYPITPSSSVAEAFQKYCSKLRVDAATGQNRFAIVQAEDEIASIGMVVGAGWNGARAFTATSGPGVSLMTEFIGLAYFAEIPVTIINVQRGGPSTGMPTRTQQADILSCAYASHGDTKHVLLFPEDPYESFEFSATALDLADRLQTVVFVMLDLDIGMNQRLCQPFEWDDARVHDRGKVLGFEELEAGKAFGRYRDVDGDGIPFRTWPGTHPQRGAFFTRGTSKNADAGYSERGPDYLDNMHRLVRKFVTARGLVPQPVLTPAGRPTRIGVLYYGSTSPAMHEAAERFAAEGIAVDLMRIRAYPFPESVRDFVLAHDQCFLVEQNRDAQLRTLLVQEYGLDPALIHPILHYDGTPITARFIASAIGDRLNTLKVTPMRKVAS